MFPCGNLSLRRFADEASDEARRLADCAERKQLIKKVEVTERALELEGYLTSRELKPPQR